MNGRIAGRFIDEVIFAQVLQAILDSVDNLIFLVEIQKLHWKKIFDVVAGNELLRKDVSRHSGPAESCVVSRDKFLLRFERSVEDVLVGMVVFGIIVKCISFVAVASSTGMNRLDWF